MVERSVVGWREVKEAKVVAMSTDSDDSEAMVMTWEPSGLVSSGFWPCGFWDRGTGEER